MGTTAGELIVCDRNRHDIGEARSSSSVSYGSDGEKLESHLECGLM